jgi:GalNAc-alpha-(1->4)-GalNAc-alpha-(1->3)-diNAcBac-PP-undecaprenol alpha-1,4-N-acetyl-D-galactosaminyltransferase
MRIAFVLQTFGAGGAERVASLLCSFWTEEGHEVEVITFEKPSTEPAYPIHEQVTLRPIDALNRSNNPLARLAINARRIFRLRSLFKQLKPDVIVAFTTEANVVTLWSAIGLGVPVVVSERNQPDRPSLGFLRRLARRITYPSASALVVQTEAIAEWARARFRIPVHVLPNPVQLEAWQVPPRRGRRVKRVVAVGRLARQKGFDLLIASFAQLAEKHSDWSLVIYGEGSERTALETQIGNLSLGQRIKLAGLSRDLPSILGSSDLFVLPSRYEGYPNALVEALAAGLPVIATDCPGATKQIVDGGRFGLLIESESIDALTGALDRMMSDDDLRAAFGSHAREAVAELDVSVGGRRWLDLLSSVP